jgi:hypothetical protein
MGKIIACKARAKKLDQGLIDEAPSILGRWFVEYTQPFITNIELVRDTQLIPLEFIVQDYFDIQHMVGKLDMYKRKVSAWASIFPPAILEDECQLCLYVYLLFNVSHDIGSTGRREITVDDYSLGLFDSQIEMFDMNNAIVTGDGAVAAFFTSLQEGHLKKTLAADISVKSELSGRRRL